MRGDLNKRQNFQSIGSQEIDHWIKIGKCLDLKSQKFFLQFFGLKLFIMVFRGDLNTVWLLEFVNKARKWGF